MHAKRNALFADLNIHDGVFMSLCYAHFVETIVVLYVATAVIVIPVVAAVLSSIDHFVHLLHCQVQTFCSEGPSIYD